MLGVFGQPGVEAMFAEGLECVTGEIGQWKVVIAGDLQVVQRPTTSLQHQPTSVHITHAHAAPIYIYSCDGKVKVK